VLAVLKRTPMLSSKIRLVLFAVLALAPLLFGCSRGGPLPSSEPGHNMQTELRREQDCANPKWKQANLGLWYSVCRPDNFD
jgi:hypothetical protein